MLILKLIAKIILVPVWLMLLIIWLPVHLVVGICGMFHGLGKLFFGGLALSAVVLGMWQNMFAFALMIVVTFLIVFIGTIIDVLLEEIRQHVGMIIVK